MTSLAGLLEESNLPHMLRERVKAYYKDTENRKKFEEWYRDKHKKEYEWKGECYGNHTNDTERDETRCYEAHAESVR